MGGGGRDNLKAVTHTIIGSILCPETLLLLLLLLPPASFFFCVCVCVCWCVCVRVCVEERW